MKTLVLLFFSGSIFGLILLIASIRLYKKIPPAATYLIGISGTMIAVACGAMALCCGFFIR